MYNGVNELIEVEKSLWLCEEFVYFIKHFVIF